MLGIPLATTSVWCTLIQVAQLRLVAPPPALPPIPRPIILLSASGGR